MMIRYLLEKEFKQFFRNSFLPKMIVMFPLFAMTIFPLVATFEVKNIYLSVIDNDKSPYSKELTQKIKASGYFIITDYSTTYAQSLSEVEDKVSDVILEFPMNFEKDLIKGKTANLMISANAVNGNKGGLGSSYLINIINDFSSGIRVDLIGDYGKIKTPFLEFTPLYRYNPSLLYRVYMAPAILVMVLAMVCGFLPALNIVSEKEKGTMEQMNVTPVRKMTFIIAKLIPFWFAGYIVFSVSMAIAVFVWGIYPVGSIPLMYLFSTIFILSFSGFGLVISNYAKSVQQAMFMMFFFVITFIFMSGLYTPIENMPPWAQMISHFSPLKYIIQVIRMVYLKGSGFMDLLPHFLALSSFAIFFNGWAVLSYRKSS